VSLRMFTGPDGESHFDEYELPASTPIAATAVVVVPRPESAGPSDWHNPSQRQLIIRLAGEMEIETSDGDVRRIRPGDVILAEDLTGKGHRVSQVWGDGVVAFVKLAD
jgi:quercetin dioxygenase-like cupin family protein